MKKQQATLTLVDQHMMQPPEQGETLIQTVTMSVLEVKKQEAMSLTVAAHGLDVVKEALKHAGLLRRTAEAEHAAIKKPHLERCQELDKQKRELLAFWAPVEKHLADEVNAEELAAERKAQALKAEIVKTRQAKLKEIGATVHSAILGDMNEIEFDLEFSRLKGVQEQLAKARELEAENAKLRQQVASQPAEATHQGTPDQAWRADEPPSLGEVSRGQCGPLPSGFSKSGGFTQPRPSAAVETTYASADDGYRQLVDTILALPIPPGPKADDVQDVIDRICGEILAIAKR